ncbi:uncharacterized protein K460DRAFT_401809 [Cucurbitaria berberidis CBS 394.84]|uniref:Uncharacterized protein n=1 Tax=Cucurbitaria berberidis CBS 394.84 TaxID=1168544 RepID=A0A9P4GV18_9PLEO|nr:uncharacterized protein K460DRAFT_401809 [Cucurbitaria berberidis CBS 394.84]KAF1851799.1 hypothetical protein K460DRAFT_401809 [Cucurbitaria berberidis CBS 394.84]
MSSEGSKNSQQPSGGRSTGAEGGPSGYFQCANYREGHPLQYRWVPVNGSLCAHCQCAPRR